MESEETKRCGNVDYSQENSDANPGSEKVLPQVVQSTIPNSLIQYAHCSENIYLGDKKKRVNKEIRRMSCDCTYNPEEHNFTGCGEDCLNRLLMIECNSRCPCGEFCSNRKFQEGQKIKVEAFKTSCKGTGLKTLEDIPANQFVMEYCGEVMGYDEFESRVETYDKENRKHYYFMTLKADEIIDATHWGNLSRFINHSCDPNCETQKWTVNGYLRIGFFSIKDIKAGTELTFDYKFQRYGKKAQVCYCESPNCRGYIGGEKHTPLKSVISGRASFSATNSPKRNRRGRLAEDFDDKTLELEITQLLGSEKGIKGDGEALKLSQFMVRAGTAAQRSLLLDTLLATDDQTSLKSFVQYQGLSLLWSWMVDIGDDSQHLQKKIVQVLKHLPISNLNQIKDSKVLKVINKWARKPSVTGIAEEETSSATSDVDSQRLSPMELSDDTSNREATISSSSTENDFPTEVKNTTKEESSKLGSEIGVTSATKLETTCEVDNVFQVLSEKCEATGVMKSDSEVVQPVVGTSEESEDDGTSTDSEDITDLAADLLGSWSHLKEVYRIPKKSAIVEKCEPESTSNVVETPVTTPQQVNEEQKIPTIPAIEGDLFQEDEFLSKLGERESVASKPEANIIPTLVGGTPSDMITDGGGSGIKPVIHQRLQSLVTSPVIAAAGMSDVGVNASMVTTTASKFAMVPGQGRKNRTLPYQTGIEGERWTARHQVSTATRFSQPTGYQIPQTVTTQQTANVSNAPWQNQNTAPFPGGFQFPPGGSQRLSSTITFPSETTTSPYYQPGQVTQLENNNRYGQPQPYSTQTPQQIHQSNMFSIPVFDSTKPPPNFIPKTSQFQTNTIQGQFQTNTISYNPPQYSNIPTMYTGSKDVHDYTGQPRQVPPTSMGHMQVFGQQHVGSLNTGAPMVSSTVSETISRLRGDAGSAGTDPWPGTKSHDQELPPDWKKAYDGEGRAYYYHMVTRQTQWEPPMLVRSPPTPEVGYLGDELDSNIVMTNNTYPVKNKRQASMDLVQPLHKKRHKTPSTPPGSPPTSPVGKSTTAAADTTDARKGLYSPSALLHAKHLTPEQQKKREVFRMKLSAVVVNYLNPYHKVDCKVGRITSVDDFKFLARKLTHGVMVKELSRIKDENSLACNDSVKIKTKEYIRNYMQKFGAVYKSA